jgi:hypothetical protein
MARRGRPKKWFMLQVWRLQQIASVMTLFLLALSEATVIWGFLKYRGGLFGSPYVMIPILMAAFGGAIWAASIFWDLRLRMWRDQMAVLQERNPYAKERLTAKEMAQYSLIYIPILEKLGKEDRKAADAAEVLRTWTSREWHDDPALVREVGELFGHIGSDRMDLLATKGKKQE